MSDFLKSIGYGTKKKVKKKKVKKEKPDLSKTLENIDEINIFRNGNHSSYHNLSPKAKVVIRLVENQTKIIVEAEVEGE